MAIICIAREYQALGEEIAHELSGITGYRFVDRGVLEKDLEGFGVNIGTIGKYDERKPGFWASLSQERDEYLHFLKTAIFKQAGGGNCVFVGRGADSILRGVPNALLVKIVAPMEIRRERTIRELNVDERRAKQIMEQSDHDRRGFHRYFFSMDWDSPENYDLVINSGSLGVKQAAALVARTAEIVITPDRERLGDRRIADLNLAQAVSTHIAYEQKIPIHFLEVRADSGKVVLQGIASTHSAIETAVQAAKGLPGVDSVETEIQIVQEYSVLP